MSIPEVSESALKPYAVNASKPWNPPIRVNQRGRCTTIIDLTCPHTEAKDRAPLNPNRMLGECKIRPTVRHRLTRPVLREYAPEHNLTLRLRDFKTETLRFLHEPGMHFTNNLVERDLRMIKLHMKISGTFRSA